MVKIYVEQGENENLIVRDVNEYVYNIIEKAILQAIKEERIINWNMLRDYCMGYFMLPKVTIDRSLSELKLTYGGDC